MSTSPTAIFLSDAIKKSNLTQREIAKRAGLAKPNVLSMMKNGETKVPIERVPALADACDVDAVEFLRVAMVEYHPEMWAVLHKVFDPKLSVRDVGILDMLNKADPDGEIFWKRPDGLLMIELFTYILNWMRLAGETNKV